MVVVSSDQDLDVSLMEAAAYGQTDVVVDLLEAGADVNARDHNGDTPLMYAIRHCEPENISVLVKAGADVNIRNNNGDTPLMVAVTCNYEDIVENAKRMVDTTDYDESITMKPLIAAIVHIHFLHIVIIEMLIKLGANIYAKNSDGKSLLVLARDRYREYSYEKLLNVGVQFSQEDCFVLRNLPLENFNGKIVALILDYMLNY